jgi:hypothetical protein
LKTTILTVKLGGRLIIADPEKIDPAAGKEYAFEGRDITGEDEIEAGRRVAQDGLIGPNGMSDENAVFIHKGFTLIERQVTRWNQELSGAMLPITAANVRAAIPGVVAKRFAVEQLIGNLATQEELEAIRPKPTSATGSGDGPAPSV